MLAERLRAEVSTTPITAETGTLTVTISIGGASAERPGDHDLLQLADHELYAAKDDGRDCVRIIRSIADPLEPQQDAALS